MTARLTRQELDAIEKAAQESEDAAPGPWNLAPDGEDGLKVYGPVMDIIEDGQIFDPAYAEHIVTADPPTVLALVAEVRRFRELARDDGAVERVARSLYFDRELKRTGGIEEDSTAWGQASDEVRDACSGMAMRLIRKAVQDDAEQETTR